MIRADEIDDILEELDVLQRRLMDTPDVAEPATSHTHIDNLRTPSQKVLEAYLRTSVNSVLLRVPSVVRIIETDTTNLQIALHDLWSAKDLYESSSDNSGIGVCHGLMGIAHMAYGNLPEAINHFASALSTFIVTEDIRNVTRCLINLGVVETAFDELRTLHYATVRAMSMVPTAERRNKTQSLSDVNEAFTAVEDADDVLRSYADAMVAFKL